MSTPKTPPNAIEALFAEAVEAVESIEKKPSEPDIEIILDSAESDSSAEGIEIEFDISEFEAESSEVDAHEASELESDVDTHQLLEELESYKLQLMDLEANYNAQESQLLKAKKIIVKRKAENERLKTQLEIAQKELIQHRMLLQNAQGKIEMTSRRLSDAEEARDQSSSRAMQLQAALDQSNERLNKEQLLRSKENEETRRFGGLKVMRSLLPALDNLQLSLKHREGSLETFASGIEMVEKQMLGILSHLGLNTVNSEPKMPFDPNFHEAMLSVPSSEHTPNTIVEVIRSGYTLHDRLVRAARVSVAVPLQEDAQQDKAHPSDSPDEDCNIEPLSQAEEPVLYTVESAEATSNAPIESESHNTQNDDLDTATEILLSPESPPVVE